MILQALLILTRKIRLFTILVVVLIKLVPGILLRHNKMYAQIRPYTHVPHLSSTNIAPFCSTQNYLFIFHFYSIHLADPFFSLPV